MPRREGTFGPTWLTVRCSCGRAAARLTEPGPGAYGHGRRDVFYIVLARPYQASKAVGAGPEMFLSDPETNAARWARYIEEDAPALWMTPDDHGPFTFACDRNHVTAVEVDELRRRYDAARAARKPGQLLM